MYLIYCDKRGKHYIGETGRLTKLRLAEHSGYIFNQVSSVFTGEDFNLPGYLKTSYAINRPGVAGAVL